MSIITSLIADTDNAAQREKMACLLTRLFNGDIDPAEVFTPDYQQVTDGHTLDYRGFIQHLSHVSSQTRTIAFTVAEIACHDELLADRHIVTVTYPGGRQAEIEVYLFAALREGKIWQIHEVTRALSGDASDRTLAHATE
ncbi:nuclear transport factor 2 family protein [Enterobacter cloacae]|uniref:nuclear transport factor 2 family protein n=1 Tax=Enterobacter cloacae TaxID=550 RepID=UPI001F1EDD9C|nr:nuclear transport factor 2 family protein [Enterobacter cloacae]